MPLPDSSVHYAWSPAHHIGDFGTTGWASGKAAMLSASMPLSKGRILTDTVGRVHRDAEGETQNQPGNAIAGQFSRRRASGWSRRWSSG